MDNDSWIITFTGRHFTPFDPKIQDIDMPEELKKMMSRQASAEREKRAKIIHAEGELQASEKLAQAAEVARRLDEGQIVAWFQGALELGPRALGHRSITIAADVAAPESADHIVAETVRAFGRADILENVWATSTPTKDNGEDPSTQISFDQVYGMFDLGSVVVSLGKMDVTWGTGARTPCLAVASPRSHPPASRGRSG